MDFKFAGNTLNVTNGPVGEGNAPRLERFVSAGQPQRPCAPAAARAAFTPQVQERCLVPVQAETFTLKTQNISWQRDRMSVRCTLMTCVQSATAGGHFPSWRASSGLMTSGHQLLTLNHGLSVHTVLVAAQPGGKETARPRGAGRGLRQTHHPRRAPHLDGGVVAGRQQQLLVRRAEGHRVHHVVVGQTCQTDVVMTVPDVAVLVLCSTLEKHSKERSPLYVLPK